MHDIISYQLSTHLEVRSLGNENNALTFYRKFAKNSDIEQYVYDFIKVK